MVNWVEFKTWTFGEEIYHNSPTGKQTLSFNTATQDCAG
jgi:hypothetical protein